MLQTAPSRDNNACLLFLGCSSFSHCAATWFSQSPTLSTIRIFIEKLYMARSEIRMIAVWHIKMRHDTRSNRYGYTTSSPTMHTFFQNHKALTLLPRITDVKYKGTKKKTNNIPTGSRDLWASQDFTTVLWIFRIAFISIHRTYSDLTDLVKPLLSRFTRRRGVLKNLRLTTILSISRHLVRISLSVLFWNVLRILASTD